MTDPMDDLFGGDQPAPEPAKRPRTNLDESRKQQTRQREIREGGTGKTKIAEREFFMPVSTGFLARVLAMDNGTVRTRLRNVKPVGQVGANRPVYDFRETLPYLIKPKMTPEQFARTLNKVDLPAEINNTFWQSQRNRVKYKIEAQEAWQTEDVLEVLGDVFMTIKDVLTMSVEEMRNRAKLSDEQTKLFEDQMDELRKTLREKLIELPKERSTTSLYDKPLFGVGDSETAGASIPLPDSIEVEYADYSEDEDAA